MLSSKRQQRDALNRTGRAHALVSEGASYARALADALERVEHDTFALYCGARERAQEERMQSNVEKIRSHVVALKAAAESGDLAACEECAITITTLDPEAPEGRRIPVSRVPAAMRLACYGSRARWYEEQRLSQLARAR